VEVERFFWTGVGGDQAESYPNSGNARQGAGKGERMILSIRDACSPSLPSPSDELYELELNSIKV
jgi:hypothetical protein